MHQKGNTMAMYSCICTHNVGEKCIFNMSNIPPLFNFKNLRHNFIFVIQVNIFLINIFLIIQISVTKIEIRSECQNQKLDQYS